MDRYCLAIAFTLAAMGSTGFAADDESAKYTLRYSLTGGQKLSYEVTHVAKTKTRLKGEEEVASKALPRIHNLQRQLSKLSAEKTEATA